MLILICVSEMFQTCLFSAEIPKLTVQHQLVVTVDVLVL